ncbi:MAG: DUF6671 family protein [Candidatus Altimarinota bacterium]
MNASQNLFLGRTVVIATMHGKEQVIAPRLEAAFGLRSEVLSGLNTDRFGTFTREVKRPGDQLETLRKKASAALKLSDHDLVIASEGSFGMHPSVPFGPSNSEMVLLLDRRHGLEIIGRSLSSHTNVKGEWVTSVDEALVFARQWGFPDHGVILRLHQHLPWMINKDIHDEKILSLSVQKFLRWPGVSKVFLETDMRAHQNPTRMKVIAEATEDLIKHMGSSCPTCACPGFSVAGMRGWKSCQWCKNVTQVPLHEIWKCQRCSFEEFRMNGDGDTADPQWCERCNP